MPLHAARIEKSPRLQRVLHELRRFGRYKPGWMSTYDIIQFAHVAAVNSCISEIRKNGYNIECKRADGVFWYRLVEDDT